MVRVEATTPLEKTIWWLCGKKRLQYLFILSGVDWGDGMPGIKYDSEFKWWGIFLRSLDLLLTQPRPKIHSQLFTSK